MREPARGRFITFEGGEGAGKSTQIRRLGARLGSDGVTAVVSREPGGTPLANAIRALLVSKAAVKSAPTFLKLMESFSSIAEPGSEDEAGVEAYSALFQSLGAAIAPEAEAMLHYTARVDHWVQAINPMLTAGRWVLCDRFADSTMAYQGIAGGVGRDYVKAIAEAALPGVKPDLTIILDLPPETGLARAKAREDESRYEAFDLAYHRKVRQAFLDIAKSDPRRCVVLDAERTADEVEADVWAAVSTLREPA